MGEFVARIYDMRLFEWQSLNRVTTLLNCQQQRCFSKFAIHAVGIVEHSSVRNIYNWLVMSHAQCTAFRVFPLPRCVRLVVLFAYASKKQIVC